MWDPQFACPQFVVSISVSMVYVFYDFYNQSSPEWLVHGYEQYHASNIFTTTQSSYHLQLLFVHLTPKTNIKKKNDEHVWKDDG